jgi:hypothetical protein
VVLDEQHRWKVAEGVLGPDGLPKTVGVGIEGDRVVVNTHGYASFDDDAADILDLSIRAAQAVVRQRKRQGP